MVIIDFQYFHLLMTFGAGERIITKGKKDGFSPMVK